MSLSIQSVVAALFSAFAATLALANTCDRAAELAAQRHDVPTQILKALARVETGRTLDGVFQPWPWAINLEGRGTWFSSREAASAYLHAALAQGDQNFDVGCFQINNLWHGQAFAGVDDMLDPSRNADYAARFLKSLFLETGSWENAVGFFHSRTPDKAARYKARFDGIYAKVGPAPNPKTRHPEIARVNAFPLLQAIGSVTGGSLVPLTQGGVGFFVASQPLVESQE